MTPPARPSRRTVLQGLAGGCLLTSLNACHALPRGTATPAAPTVISLLGQLPFTAAHRGGGGDWPEMTAFAYEQCVRLPEVQALEVSVCLSADGVLVCSHDPTTTRVTGIDATIADESWSTLSRLQVLPTATTNPTQPARPLSRLEDVLTHASDHILFVEPKVPEAVAPLLDLLARAGQSERLVWKQYVTSVHFETAKQHGFTTWGYVLNEPSHTGANLARLAGSPSIDLLGAPLAEDDSFISAVVAAANRNGKKTMAWPVSTATDWDRAISLGCSGLMVSRPAELLRSGTR